MPAPLQRTWAIHGPAPACPIARFAPWSNHGVSSPVSVNFVTATGRSVATLERFDRPATGQRNLPAGGRPVASIVGHDGDADAPRHAGFLMSGNDPQAGLDPVLRRPVHGAPLHLPPGYAGGRAKRPRSPHEAVNAFDVFPCALMNDPESHGLSMTPLPRFPVPSSSTHQGASVRRPAATGAIGRHRWHRCDRCGPSLRHRSRLCLLSGYGQDRPITSRSPPMAVIIMRSASTITWSVIILAV